jgi:hypothetical protein
LQREADLLSQLSLYSTLSVASAAFGLRLSASFEPPNEMPLNHVDLTNV